MHRCCRAKAQALKDAGLGRITVSLDAMDDAHFRAMNDVDFPVDRVLDGIEAARAVGLPVKVNCVVKRGVNDDQIVPLARYFRGTGDTLRFIEFMDVGATNGWRMDDVVPAAEIVATVDAEFPLEPADAHYRGEVAKRWRYLDGRGEIGVIASVTQPFCGDCTRSRISAEGKLYTCLFAVRGHDLRALIRSGATDEDLAVRLAEIWHVRGDRYSELRTEATGRRHAAGRDELHRRLSRSLGTTPGPIDRSAGPAPFATSGLRDKVLTGCRESVAAGRRYLPRGWGDLGRQLAIWFGFALAYQLARGLTDRDPTKAFSNGFRVVDLETNLTNRLYELTFEQFVAQRHWLAQLVSWTYWNSEFTVVGLALLWVYFGTTTRSPASATRSCSRT